MPVALQVTLQLDGPPKLWQPRHNGDAHILSLFATTITTNYRDCSIRRRDILAVVTSFVAATTLDARAKYYAKRTGRRHVAGAIPSRSFNVTADRGGGGKGRRDLKLRAKVGSGSADTTSGPRHFFTPSRKSRTTLKFGQSSLRCHAAEFLGVLEHFAPGFFFLATLEFRCNFLDLPLNHTWQTFFFFNALTRALPFYVATMRLCIVLIAGRWRHVVKRPRQSRFFVFRRLRVASFSLSGNCKRAKRHFSP